jgi:hypothetical protein
MAARGSRRALHALATNHPPFSSACCAKGVGDILSLSVSTSDPPLLPGALQLVGPARVWLKNAPLPGLNMSRSLGDLVAKQAGVISAPYKTVHVLQPTDRALVVASDGVGDAGQRWHRHWESVTRRFLAAPPLRKRGLALHRLTLCPAAFSLVFHRLCSSGTGFPTRRPPPSPCRPPIRGRLQRASRDLLAPAGLRAPAAPMTRPSWSFGSGSLQQGGLISQSSYEAVHYAALTALAAGGQTYGRPTAPLLLHCRSQPAPASSHLHRCLCSCSRGVAAPQLPSPTAGGTSYGFPLAASF